MVTQLVGFSIIELVWSQLVALAGVERQARIASSINHSYIFIMRLLIALILPWLTFFTISRPIAGIICLILQLTIVGWLPAAIWAVYALGQYKTDKKIEKALGQRSI